MSQIHLLHAIATVSTATELPTAAEMASWSSAQFIQVMLGFTLAALGAIAIFFIRQMSENAKELNKQHDVMFQELVNRYDIQDARYDKQEVRHIERDRLFNDTLRAGLDKIAEKMAEAVKSR